MPDRWKGVTLALSIYAVWVGVTYLLEGRRLTLLRPEAVRDRAVYALIANVLIGTVGSVWVLHRLLRMGAVTREEIGFGTAGRSALRVLTGLVLGFAAYALQRPPTFHPVALLNLYAQVSVGSVAEVLVCWSVVGSALRGMSWDGNRILSQFLATGGAGILFGAYHFAHSPPFNTLSSVLLLSAVGLATGTFFYLSRSSYGAVLFHTGLGVYGVARALSGAGQLTSFERPMFQLYGMALLSIGTLVLLDVIAFPPVQPMEDGRRSRNLG